MFKKKKVLLVGLGILGGGVATAKFLLDQGVKLTVTDKREKDLLKKSIADLPRSVMYTLGKHIEKDFKNAEIVVANPAVPRYGEWIELASKLGKVIYNDLTLFLTSIASNGKDVIAITGTRGKTTTTMWTHHFLKGSIVGGNIPEIGPLKIIGGKGNPYVLETSSFQLEYMTRGLPAPHIAFITNLYQDHLNRHKTMREYVKAKAGIFMNQTKDDFLICNIRNSYTKDFLKLKPKSKVLYVSTKPLPNGKEGIYVSKGSIYVALNGRKDFIAKSPFDVDFLNENLIGALLIAYLYIGNWKEILPRIKTLPNVSMRREVILKSKDILVINDSAGTSPDATIALLSEYKKTSKSEKIFITGGTDKQLDFKEWAKQVKKEIDPSNIFFLEGSATRKMIAELNKIHFFKKQNHIQTFETMKDLAQVVARRVALKKGERKIVLFSPSSASFEKYKNEFDRGNQFSKIIRKYF